MMLTKGQREEELLCSRTVGKHNTPQWKMEGNFLPKMEGKLKQFSKPKLVGTSHVPQFAPYLTHRIIVCIHNKIFKMKLFWFWISN